jgi:CheY-like chemotaxis protein
MKVLIADDSGALAANGIVFLTLWGHAVETAGDGLAALRKVREWQPDLVLAKTSLERMDGLSLTAAIRSGSDTRHVCVILAGRPEDEYARRRSRELGAFAYLSTPLSVSELRGALSRLGTAPRSTAQVRRSA